jgi:hypothetical protein
MRCDSDAAFADHGAKDMAKSMAKDTTQDTPSNSGSRKTHSNEQQWRNKEVITSEQLKQKRTACAVL